MKEKLAGKFASADHAGPKDVADFLELSDDEDMAMIKKGCLTSKFRHYSI